jgi:predicted lactoylglutathione lyase
MTMIFVNLPVRNLDVSRRFYEALGFTINEAFSDETAASVVISDSIYVMLLTHAKMADFTSLPIGDATQQVQHMLALSRDSREAVDTIMDAALSSGGTEPRGVTDYGWMYYRTFADPDGHVWEPMWMDSAAASAGPPDMQEA